MRGKAPLSRESYVRDLPFGVQRTLAFDLDLSNLWENLVVQIPKHLNYSSEDDFIPRYTSQHVGLFARQLQIPNGSPTRAILQDWGTQNCTIQNLLDALNRADLIAAANFIKHEVLKEPDEDDEEEEEPVDELPIPPPLLPPILIRAVPGDHQHRAQMAGYQATETMSELDLLKKGVREPKQNDLSSTPPVSFISKSLSEVHTQKHERQYESMGGAGALAQSPNLNTPVCCEKPLGKASVKKIGQDLLQPTPDLFPLPSKCTGVAVEPVIKNSDVLQHIPFRDLEEITGGFNEIPYLSGGRMIGKGGFGMVHLGVDRDDRKVAVKVLKNQTDTLRKQFRTEVDTLSRLKNENLLTLLGYSCDGPKSCIVYDYMVNGSLEDRLSCKNGTPPLSAEVRISICKGSASGIAFLNSLGYIHRDIKSANILLDKDFVPKLGDFATTRLGPSGDGHTQAETSILIGTSAYLAPEAHNFDVSAKLDSFSFGVVILELITGLPAYDAKREERDLRSHVLENCEDIMMMVDRYGGDWIEGSVRTLYSVARRCLASQKRKRALVKDVFQEILAL
ncbi:interleukin-1 receptor-associated kinase 4-like [Liolophura sinensis]|uniref:interleukin-1 receptor-associated kinase 4-like n=1 Tax=Liolophura sinensis TaxID=3198878 RepID=UPI003157F925